MLTVSDLAEPRGLPLVGHLPALAGRDAMHRVLYAWRDRHGETFRIRLGRNIAVVTSSPDIVDTVLRERPEVFRRGRAMSRLIAELGAPGLFDAEGAEWRRLRRIAMHGLNAGYLRNAFATITRSTGRLRDEWAKAATGDRIPVLDDLLRYTLEVSVGLTMGYDLDAVRRGREEGLPHQLSLVLDTLSRRLNSPVPYWRWVRLPADRRTDATVARFSALVRERYADARRRVGAGEAPGTYLESLASASLTSEERITEQDVVGTVLNMIVAGEDTTAATVAWAMFYLARNPRVQQQVRQEAAQVLGSDGYAADPATLARLTYAEAVVGEAIRLRPAAPFVIMEAMADTTVTDGTNELRIDRDTMVIPLLTYGSDDDPLRYPDPAEFKPERRPPGPAEAGNTPPFLPFGGGPRFCPGRNLAMLESTLVVSMACHNFTIEADTSAGPVGERVTFAVSPTNLGIRLRPVATGG